MFVTGFGLEFYPLGGDPKVTTSCSAHLPYTHLPIRSDCARDNAKAVSRVITTFCAFRQVLSDFIVESRGIVPRSIKSGMDNIEQVNLIVNSTFEAATQPDPGPDGGRPLPSAFCVLPQLRQPGVLLPPLLDIACFASISVLAMFFR